jgi:hypothetical protein
MATDFEGLLAEAESLVAGIPRGVAVAPVPQRLDELQRAAGAIRPAHHDNLPPPPPATTLYPSGLGALPEYDHDYRREHEDEPRALRLLAAAMDGESAGMPSASSGHRALQVPRIAGESGVGARFDAARARREIARLELHGCGYSGGYGAAEDSSDGADDGRDADRADGGDEGAASEWWGRALSEPLGEVDVGGFLAHHHDMLVATAIEDVRAAAHQDLDDALQRESSYAWRAETNTLSFAR